jgi:topoisomerase-4 subunit A
LLGEFRAEDKLLIITQSGKVKAVKPDLAMHFDKDMIVLEKWKPKKPISAIYFDGEKERYYVKRFLIEATEKEEFFITEHLKAQLEIVSTDYRPVAEVIFSKRSLEKQKVNFEDFIAIKGIKAQGNQLTTEKIKLVNLLEALPFEEPEEERFEEIEVVDEEVIEEQLPTEAAEKESKKIISEAVSPDDKAAIALRKSIAKKKAEEQKRDDESQTKLF